MTKSDDVIEQLRPVDTRLTEIRACAICNFPLAIDQAELCSECMDEAPTWEHPAGCWCARCHDEKCDGGCRTCYESTLVGMGLVGEAV